MRYIEHFQTVILQKYIKIVVTITLLNGDFYAYTRLFVFDFLRLCLRLDLLPPNVELDSGSGSGLEKGLDKILDSLGDNGDDTGAAASPFSISVTYAKITDVIPIKVMVIIGIP